MKLTVCGTDCSECGCFGTICQGCNSCGGKVFHAPEGQACPLYQCARGERGLADCGQCPAVPCEIWQKTRDPKFSDEAFQQNIQQRLHRLREVKRPKFSNPLIAVQDMAQALKFYKTLFDLDVVCDLGWCKVLSCGLTLQEHFDTIAGFPAETMKFRSNTMELYFETEDFDGFMTLLDRNPQVEKLHEARTYPWLQRGIHIYDPAGHLIEVSESMYSVACRQFRQGKSAAEVAELLQHPQQVVESWYEKYQAEKF